MNRKLKIFIGVEAFAVLIYLLWDSYLTNQQIMLRNPYQKVVIGFLIVPLITCLVFVALHYLNQSRLSRGVRNILRFNVVFVAIGLLSVYLFYALTIYEHSVTKEEGVFITNYSNIYDNSKDTHVYYKVRDTFFMQTPYAFIEFPENN